MTIPKKRWDETHPYLRSTTWETNPFWRNDKFTPKAKQYFENWLERMKQKDRLKNLTEI